MPTKQELTTIRRAAARARWDGPHVKTTRLHITLPADLAEALNAAAKAGDRSISDIATQAISDALADGLPRVESTAPFAAEADVSAIVDDEICVARLHFRPNMTVAVEHIRGPIDSPFFGWLRRRALDVLGIVVPMLCLSRETHERHMWRGIPIAIKARRLDSFGQ